MRFFVKSGASASEIVTNFRSRKQRVPGFGHAWRHRDPRTLALVAKAKEWGVAGPHLALTESISAELQLPANIDGAISGITSDIGVPWQYGRAFFIIPRVVGPAAHAVEETTRDHPSRVIDIKDVAVRLVLFVFSFPTRAAS
jgi:citrate synthase